MMASRAVSDMDYRGNCMHIPFMLVIGGVEGRLERGCGGVENEWSGQHGATSREGSKELTREQDTGYGWGRYGVKVNELGW
jgi:hypothetical protein